MPVYNNQVKRPGEEYQYTVDQIKELKKCSDDLFYFLNYVKIIHPDLGRIVFKPYDFQKEMFQLLLDNRFCAFLVARQMGKSLSVGAYALWYSMFNSDKVIGIVSNKESSAIDFLARIKVMYEELPEWIKPGIIEYNKKTIMFENGTIIVAGATSKNAFRGKTANIIISDELAFVDPGKAEEFYMSNYPTISVSKYGKFIAISTPNGIGGLFYELYRGSEKKTNEFVHFRADWSAHPDRDAEWQKTQLGNIGPRRFSQEYAVEFLGSSSTVIDRDTLVRLINQEDDEYHLLLKDRMRVYEKPIQGCDYIMGVDPSKGTGQHDACVQVFKISSISPIELQQVAVFQDNETDTYMLSQIIVNISYLYNDAYIMCENNGEGSAVISEIWWTHECENLICEGSKSSKLGIRATVKSKAIAVLLTKKLIEDGSIKLVDSETIKQLTTFIDKNGKFTGNGSPDDLISAMYWAPYIFTMDILDETMTFRDNGDDSDEWGILGEDSDIPEGYTQVM